MAGLSNVLGFFLFIMSAASSQGLPETPAGENQTSRGMEYYRSVLERRPGLPEAHFGAGWESYQAQDYALARHEFESSLQTENLELRSSALYNLGNARYQQGQYQESLDAYRKALELNPGDRDAKHNYELALNMIRNPPSQDQNQSGNDPDQKEDTPDPEENGEDESRAPREGKPDQTADVEAILNALEANDKNLMKRRWMNRESVILEKDW